MTLPFKYLNTETKATRTRLYFTFLVRTKYLNTCKEPENIFESLKRQNYIPYLAKITLAGVEMLTKISISRLIFKI